MAVSDSNLRRFTEPHEPHVISRLLFLKGGRTGINFSRLKDIEKHPVVVFAELVVCLHCGKAEFIVPEKQLAPLAKSNSAHAD